MSGFFRFILGKSCALRLMLLALNLFLYQNSSWAQSSASIDYNTGTSKLRFYDGSSWYNFGDDTIIGSCATQGQFDYDFTNNEFRYCDGTNFRTFKAQVTSAVCGNVGTLDYDASKSVFEYCNGTNWVRAKLVPETSGFFVLTNTSYNGNFTDLTTANATCVTELSTYNWLNKATAGPLNTMRVKAFLCSASGCNNLPSLATYKFAVANNVAVGGGSFSTNSSGAGPDNSDAWNTASAFSTTTYDIWTGRSAGSNTLWGLSTSGSDCTNWSSSSSGVSGTYGSNNQTTSSRWASTTGTCNLTKKIICYVNPAPAAFDFVDVNTAVAATPTYSSILRIYDLKAPGTVSISGANGSPKFRVCSNSDCSSVVSTWATTGSILAGQYLQLRMLSPAVQSTSYTATVSIDGITDDWAVTLTGAVSDTTPNAFSFPPTVNAAPNTVTNSQIIQITGFDAATVSISAASGSPQFRVCADSLCNDVLVDWTSSATPMGPNQYIQARMTAGALDAAANIATVTIGGVIGTWSLTPRTTPIGYFVFLGNIQRKGSLGGLTGANTYCLEQLQKRNWLGKGTITLNDNVKAFLCDSTTCNNLLPNYKYYFASTTGASVGGSYFTTNGTGAGPVDSANWYNSAYLGNGTPYYYWSGRAQGSTTTWPLTPDGTYHCQNWSSESGSEYGRTGYLNTTSYGRWASGTTACSGTQRSLICYVDPEGSADNFDFTDQSGLPLGTLIESEIVAITGLNISGYVSVNSNDGSLAYRICADSTCASVITDWTFEAGPIADSTYLQIRMMTSGLSATSHTATVNIGAASDTWTLTTISASVDNTPDSFTIPNTDASPLDAYVTSSIIQVTGFDSTDATVTGASGTPEFRVCADAACTNVLSDWATGPGTVLPNQYIQLRIWAATEGWTTRVATITMGSLSVNWNQTTGATAFFVLSGGVTKGSLSGLAGANSWCLTDLTNNSWKGKANAGTLTAAKVQAFLCDSTTCQMPTAGAPYTFANAGDVTAGGTTMFIGLDGYGPGDTADWSDAVHFNTATNYWSTVGAINDMYWNGVGLSSTYTCNDWTSGGGGANAYYGTSNFTTSQRWQNTFSSCNTSYKLICMVNLDSTPDPFSFTDITNQSQNTLVTSNIVQINGFDSMVAVSIDGANGSPQFRICSDSACSSVITDWTSSNASIQAGQYVQLRLTTAPAAGTTFSAGLIISGVTDSWSAKTSGTIPKAYFVMTNTAYNGNLSGKAGADASCLTELTNNNWTGKASAGTLTLARVRSFFNRNDLYSESPYVSYAFARATDTTGGGATFTAGLDPTSGPNDTNSWSGLTYFNSTAKYWTGNWYNSTPAKWVNAYSNSGCNDFTNSQSQNTGNYGDPTTYLSERWEAGFLACNTTNRLICIVDPILANTPTLNFIDLTNQATNTFVTSNIIQISGLDLPVKFKLDGNGTPQLRICADSSCSSIKLDWTTWTSNSTVWVANGDYIQLQMRTSPAAGVTQSSRVTVGATFKEWFVTTSGTAREEGYFVLSSGSWTGNLGGAAGADSLCLTDLTNNTWLGKGSAGSLTADRVKAFICEDYSGKGCAFPERYTRYKFAVSGNASLGGASFTTDGSNQAPFDAQLWTKNEYFGSEIDYWTGYRSSTGFCYNCTSPYSLNYWDDKWAGENTCLNWSSASSSDIGYTGNSLPTTASGYHRWIHISSACNVAKKLICVVGPDTIPDALNFTDLTNQATSTVVNSNIVQVTGTVNQDLIVRLEGVGPPKVRWCDNSTCTGTTSSWSYSLVVPANYWIQLQMTTSSVAGTTFRAGVRVGTNTSPYYNWKVTTSGSLPAKGYFVMSDSTWDGALGGLSGADSECLSELNTKTWKDKAGAGTLNSTRVKAFLCDKFGCSGQLTANTTYFYAKAGSATIGGDSFTTDGSGYGPNDYTIWAKPTVFGIEDTKIRTNRGSVSAYKFSNNPAYTNNSICQDWTATSGGTIGVSTGAGWTGSNSTGRWTNYWIGCGQMRMICVVNP